ncbi:MAG TPA: glycosyltransferase family 1 protein [Steroidobacteraceae bacterium]|nr:glycosyltransferase family 1 protein [Steroidobacteraceae bacterium]
MRIALVTDAWRPQTNGVVTTLTRTLESLERLGHSTRAIAPVEFRTVPCPTYPEIRLALFPGRGLARTLAAFAPEALHIATEGPLGQTARAWCLREGMPFTTSYHTQFPQYIRARIPIPVSWSYAFLRRFHSAAERVMVATPRVQRDLEQRGFRNLALWTRGVDVELFRPHERDYLPGQRPIMLYAGRVAVEKNLEAYLSLALPGTKYVVGGGPALEALKARYPQVIFTGYKYGEELARHFGGADVFVFPSRTDTFGLVLLEAMACGVPVAAYPVAGPIDVVQGGVSGCLHEDLAAAVVGALELDRDDCRRYALGFTWERATREFESNLAPRAYAGRTDATP